MWLQNNIHSWKVGLTDSRACSELTHWSSSNGRKADTQLWSPTPLTQMSADSLLYTVSVPVSSKPSTEESLVSFKNIIRVGDGGEGLGRWVGG